MPRTSTRTRQNATTAAPAATTPQTPAAPRGLAALRNAAAVKTTVATAGSDVPVMTAPSDAVSQAIQKWNDAYDREKQATSDREEAEGVIEPVADELRINHCISCRDVVASIRIKSNNGDSVLFQRQARCCKIKARDKKRDGSIVDNEAKLIDACGSDDATYRRLFKSSTVFNLDGEKLMALPGAQDIIDKIIDALGSHADAVLEDGTVISPTEDYYRARLGLIDPHLKQVCDRVESDALVRPIAPSFKQ